MGDWDTRLVLGEGKLDPKVAVDDVPPSCG
jgi:hypothetical protein